jgi:hypothetical protein
MLWNLPFKKVVSQHLKMATGHGSIRVTSQGLLQIPLLWWLMKMPNHFNRHFCRFRVVEIPDFTSWPAALLHEINTE